MTQIEIIMMMEKIFDEADETLRNFSSALKKYREVQAKIRELAEYYNGEDWRKDFEDDEAGKLPANLKRGVLSEDGIYNLLSDNDELRAYILEVLAEILREGRF